MVGWFYGHMTVAQFAISFVFPLLSCFLSKACFACIVISSLHNSSFTRPIILSSLLTQLCTSLSLQELQQQHILSIQSQSAISQEATAAKAGKETICNVRSLRTRTGSHKTTVGRLCESQGWGSFFLKEIATAYQHFLCLKRSAQLTHLTKVSCSDLFYHDSYKQNISRGSGTFYLAFTQPAYCGFVRPCTCDAGKIDKKEN